jgi:5'(3')-deoxyribonucleotidase
MKGQKRNLIAFDLDDTLVDTLGYILDRVRQRFDLPTRPEPSKWYDHTELGLKDKELWDLCNDAFKFSGDLKVMPGAAQLLESIYRLSRDPITIITARPYKWAASTHSLVDRFCKVPYRIVFTNQRSKVPHLNGFEYFVEDRRKNALNIARTGITVFVPIRSYNGLDASQGYDVPLNVHRIKGLSSISMGLPALVAKY